MIFSFSDAERLRESMGDRPFFDGLNAAGGDSDWGELEGDWNALRFQNFGCLLCVASFHE